MKHEKIYFGQVAYKFKISDGLINRINDRMDELIGRGQEEDISHALVGKIKKEYNFIPYIGEVDKDDEIKKCIFQVTDTCPQDYIFEIDEVNMDSCWINDQREHEYQGIHQHHGQTWLGFSSILYLKVPDLGKEITDTGEPLNGRTTLIGGAGGTWSHPSQTINPKVGDFYIFPYDMEHCVYPFKGNGIRRTLVGNFDVFRTKKYQMKEGKRVYNVKDTKQNS
jgi:hypothetical protein